jgi:hypothetical protein
MDVNEVITTYIKYRDYIDKREDDLKQELKLYRDAMKVLEAAVNKVLSAQNVESIRTDAGTAYFTEFMSVSTVDRSALFDYVKSHGAFDLLTSAVAKDQVREFMSSHDGQQPPGVNVTFVKKVNFRRGN